MRLSGSPGNSEVVKEFVGKFEFWADGLNVPQWQRIWRSLSGLQWVLFFVLMSIGATLTANVESAKRAGKWKSQAHELLQEGISDDEEREAIEVTLALLSEYPTSMSDGSSGNGAAQTFLAVFCVGFIVCVLLSFLQRAPLESEEAFSRSGDSDYG